VAREGGSVSGTSKSPKGTGSARLCWTGHWAKRDARQLGGAGQDSLRETGRLGDLVGGFKAHAGLIRIVEWRRRSAFVLIIRETGSGKSNGKRERCISFRARGGPFVAINCFGRFQSPLMESRNFRHERGASQRRGEALVASNCRMGARCLLDEIGECPHRRSQTIARTGRSQGYGDWAASWIRPVELRVSAAIQQDPESSVFQRAFAPGKNALFPSECFSYPLAGRSAPREDIPAADGYSADPQRKARKKL